MRTVNALAMRWMHGDRPGRGATETLLLLLGLGFAGLLVWAIQRSGKTSS